MQKKKKLMQKGCRIVTDEYLIEQGKLGTLCLLYFMRTQLCNSNHACIMIIILKEITSLINHKGNT